LLDDFPIVEVAIPRNFFVDILQLIAELRPPPAHQQRKASEIHAFTETYRKGILMTMKFAFPLVEPPKSPAWQRPCAPPPPRRGFGVAEIGRKQELQPRQGRYPTDIGLISGRLTFTSRSAPFGTLLSRATASLDYRKRPFAYFVIFRGLLRPTRQARGAPQSAKTHRP
jgi:hypothetical protein